MCKLSARQSNALVTHMHVMPNRKKLPFSKDRRRKHHHWRVTVSYKDGEKFARVYTDKEKARGFAEREKRSPVVKRTRVHKIS